MVNGVHSLHRVLARLLSCVMFSWFCGALRVPLADCIGFAIILQSSGRGSECLFCGFGEGYAAILLEF